MSDDVTPWINKGKSDYEGRIDFARVEETKKCKFVGDFAIKLPNGTWSDLMYPVFYQSNPAPEHSHYFALLFQSGQLMITDASSVAGIAIAGAQAKSGEIVYSRCRWDARYSEDGTANIDGGRDYIKSSCGKRVWLTVEDGEIKIIDNPDPLFVQEKLSN